MPTTFRKRPVVIEAVQFDGDLTSEVADFIGGYGEHLPPVQQAHNWDEPSMTLRLWNSEEKQHIIVPVGHWIIKGLKGEYYPCSDEVMKASYDEVQGGEDSEQDISG